MPTGIELIEAERLSHPGRGYDDAHDDGHSGTMLVSAAIAYAEASQSQQMLGFRADMDLVREMHWPFEAATWSPRDIQRNLVKAGAFIAAAIDRNARFEAALKKLHQ